jgi:hypothetical protein
MEQKWLFDTGAALTCMSSRAFRKISKDCRHSKIDTIGRTEQGASGGTLIPEGVYMIPMEWDGKNNATRPGLQKPVKTNNSGF